MDRKTCSPASGGTVRRAVHCLSRTGFPPFTKLSKALYISVFNEAGSGPALVACGRGGLGGPELSGRLEQPALIFAGQPSEQHFYLFRKRFHNLCLSLIQ